MSKISVVLAVFNEEDNLADCLESVKSLADEIVVVDGGSVDKTVEIAKKFKAKIIETDNPLIFHINKQKAIDAATGDWIMQLDADERVTSELKKEILKVVSLKSDEIEARQIDSAKKRLFERHQKVVEKRDGKKGNYKGEVAAFFVPRKNYFLGRYLMHGGVYPDGVIRLFKKGKAYFPCKSVHEQIEIKGRVAWLENDLVHMADPTFSRYLARSNRYTTLTAEEYKKDEVGTGIISKFKYMKLFPILRFLELFIRHKGFMDGFAGLVFSYYSALHIKTSYIKYWEKIVKKEKL